MVKKSIIGYPYSRMPVGSENDFVRDGVFHLNGKGRDGQLRLIARPFVLSVIDSERSDWKSGFRIMSQEENTGTENTGTPYQLSDYTGETIGKQ